MKPVRYRQMIPGTGWRALMVYPSTQGFYQEEVPLVCFVISDERNEYNEWDSAIELMVRSEDGHDVVTIDRRHLVTLLGPGEDATMFEDAIAEHQAYLQKYPR